MAVHYVRSAAAGTGTGASWTNAYTNLTAAFSGGAAGDTYYVSEDHAETAAGITLTSKGTLTAPTFVVCANHAGSVPPVAADLATTATVSCTGSNSLTFASCTHYYGIIFNVGGTTVSNIIVLTANNTFARFDACSLRGNDTAGNNINIGSLNTGVVGTYVELNNTTMSFATVSDTVNINNTCRWRNTASALIGAAVPTQLLTPLSPGGHNLEVFGVDLSAAGTGKTLVALGGTGHGSKFRFLDCKLNASVTKTDAGEPGFGSSEIDFIRCGASGVNYAIHRHRLAGALDHETTIVRTGGASDGTTTLAWKIVTTASSNYTTPFECPPIAIWNDTSGSSVTATVEGIWGGGAVPNNDDVWLDVEYLGDASSPQASFVSNGKVSVLGTQAGQTSSASSWGGSTTAFKMAVTFTPNQKGWIYARVKCAKTSTTFYIDPLVTLS